MYQDLQVVLSQIWTEDGLLLFLKIRKSFGTGITSFFKGQNQLWRLVRSGCIGIRVTTLGTELWIESDIFYGQDSKPN
jgi:hypothetical protein